MGVISEAVPVVQSIESSRKVELLSLAVAFVKELKERNLGYNEIQGLLRLLENLLKEEDLL